MQPLFSICIPTYNRADLLNDTLTRLAPLNDCGKPFEIVISDNGSPDHTQAVVDAHRARNPALRAFRFPENRGAPANWLNALRQARGEFMAYLADDDSLIADNLLVHVETLQNNPQRVATYTDWVAWDDQEEREINRHFNGMTEPLEFGPAAPLDLVNFILNRFVPPEVAVYRRDALMRALAFHGRSLPFYMTMYKLSRLGEIAFDPLPFYREHRILKNRFSRTVWANMAMQFQMIGDEMRLSLEEMVLMGLQDAGASHLSDEQAQIVRRSIERILHGRLRLEVERACGRKDWIMAVEFMRRHVLWHGPGSEEEVRRDALRIVIPAALQAVQLTFNGLSDAAGISFRGFESGRSTEFFTKYYPDTPIVVSGFGDGRDSLIVHRDESTLAQDQSADDPTKVVVLEQLLDLYRITPARIDLSGF
jgi:hypothetical protein